MRIENHEIKITRNEIIRLWERAFKAQFPEALDIRDALRAVMSELSVQEMKRMLEHE
jgi:hypothetical protein